MRVPVGEQCPWNVHRGKETLFLAEMKGHPGGGHARSQISAGQRDAASSFLTLPGYLMISKSKPCPRHFEKKEKGQIRHLNLTIIMKRIESVDY